MLLNPKVIQVQVLNFWPQKVGQHASVMFPVDRNGIASRIFEKKWPNDATTSQCTPNGHSRRMHWLLNNHIRVFSAPDAAVLLVNIAV